MIESFSTVFISIILEAVPFVMIGAFVSSVIQVFVSEQTISRIIPKNKLLGLLMASLMGIIFPVCECAIVPIMRRLLKKGVPLDISITFMLAVPIVNPVVLASTYYAFSDKPYFVLLRGGMGLIAAILVGYIVSAIQDKENPLKDEHHEHSDEDCSCGHHHEHNHDNHGHEHHDHGHKRGWLSMVSEVIEHTGSELYDVGKMLIIGAFLASIMQTFVPRSFILSIGRGTISSTLVMLAMAFILSLCSEADAFIARTFAGQFTQGSIVGFLIFGPMIDIKNTLMLSAGFKGKYILRLVLVIAAVCFSLASIANLFVF
ncbi:putative two-component membrane permease complex subunit [Oxobacter pfennigii]|uniref:Putative two-component membrane permease complex subunit n=1 Tax=Oxobacter pfennigii TaxID=36849 RepID=A0A0P9AIZ8_9CLOT|nr:permease [Oxobacter pfennigii]KPU45418.1 putative two-component membrane permease complex subunit [Oxobacter pfennigii]